MLDQRPQDIQLPTVGEGVQQTSERNQETTKKKLGIMVKCLACAFAISLVVIAVLSYYLDNWIGFQDKCYYFSKEEKNWSSSRDSCLSENADLVLISTPEEMQFLKRYKCTSDHWIHPGSQTKQWTEIIVPNHWLNTKENEECPYLNEDSIATARCYTERKWICEKKIR
ncbi:C-type lectin domain family 2 member B isoform X2 [Phacochoerus africanus]|uniref:C-type lectin domain family 2 member B isoform X2 n=1 Tax=Phacochoerus africanus TaxID=41426 RepID=UPI001FD8D642|nr:C-type lectin domain family 2 member B isoform X2 [Phacochoerus africanus]